MDDFRESLSMPTNQRNCPIGAHVIVLLSEQAQRAATAVACLKRASNPMAACLQHACIGVGTSVRAMWGRRAGQGVSSALHGWQRRGICLLRPLVVRQNVS